MLSWTKLVKESALSQIGSKSSQCSVAEHRSQGAVSRIGQYSYREQLAELAENPHSVQLTEHRSQCSVGRNSSKSAISQIVSKSS